MNAIDWKTRQHNVARRDYLPEAPQRNIVAILVRRKWQVLIVFLMTVAAVSGVTFLLPKQYQSHMKILVKNERTDVLVTPDGSSGSSPYRAEVSEEQINTEIELLSSTDLLQQVVVKSNLDRLENSNSLDENQHQAIAIEKAVMRLKKQLKITPVRKANIIEVRYAAGDPRLASAVLKQLSDSFLETHLRVHATPGTYEFFRKQASRYQEETRVAEENLAGFRKVSNIVMLPEEKIMVLQRASEFETARRQTDAAAAEYKDKIANISQQLQTTPHRVLTQSRTVPNQYSVDHLGTMLVDLQNKRTQLLSKFLPDDRLVEEVSQQIADTQAALEKASKVAGVEEATDVNPVRQTLVMQMATEQAALAGIEARQQVLSTQAQSYLQQLTRLGDLSAEFDELVRVHKEAEDNYVLYSKKSEEARIAESLDQQKIANVAIAETPTEPQIPSLPNVPLNLTLGVVLAAFVSMGLPLVRDGLQGLVEVESRASKAALVARGLTGLVEQASDLEDVTGLDVLATPSQSRSDAAE